MFDFEEPEDPNQMYTIPELTWKEMQVLVYALWRTGQDIPECQKSIDNIKLLRETHGKQLGLFEAFIPSEEELQRHQLQLYDVAINLRLLEAKATQIDDKEVERAWKTTEKDLERLLREQS